MQLTMRKIHVASVVGWQPRAFAFLFSVLLRMLFFLSSVLFLLLFLLGCVA